MIAIAMLGFSWEILDPYFSCYICALFLVSHHQRSSWQTLECVSIDPHVSTLATVIATYV